MTKLVRTIPIVQCPVTQVTAGMDLCNKIVVAINKESKRTYIVMQQFSGQFGMCDWHATCIPRWYSSLEELMANWEVAHEFYMFTSYEEALITLSKFWNEKNY